MGGNRQDGVNRSLGDEEARRVHTLRVALGLRKDVLAPICGNYSAGLLGVGTAVVLRGTWDDGEHQGEWMGTRY